MPSLFVNVIACTVCLLLVTQVSHAQTYRQPGYYPPPAQGMQPPVGQMRSAPAPLSHQQQLPPAPPPAAYPQQRMEPTYQQQPAYQRPGYPPQGAAPASKRTKKKPPASKDQQLYIDVLDIGGHDHLLFDSD